MLSRNPSGSGFAEMQRTEAGETGEFKFSFGNENISRTSIINHLARNLGAKRYLEIGVRDGRNLKKVRIPEKIGVDPAPGPDVTHQMTSDEYFAGHGDQRFDIIFIDGMHLEEFVVRDIENALKCLNKGGYIIVHDCNPPTEFHQRENYEIDGELPAWNGTVWRGWLKFRSRWKLSMHVVDTDYGVGIMQRGSQQRILATDISYREFEPRREMLLPLISVRQFLKRY